MSTVDQLRRLFTWKLWKSSTRKVDFPKKDKKIIQIGDAVVYNTKAIYSRIICLISLINPLKVLNYKLPLIPYSKAMAILGILKPNPSWNPNNLLKLLVIITNSHIPSWLMEVQSFKQSNSQKKRELWRTQWKPCTSILKPDWFVKVFILFSKYIWSISLLILAHTTWQQTDFSIYLSSLDHRAHLLKLALANLTVTHLVISEVHF